MPDVATELTRPGTARCHALLPCAGTGTRAGTGIPKQYQPIAGQPMVMHTLDALRAVPRLDLCVVVIAFDDVFWTSQPVGTTLARRGGATRAESVFNGLQALRELGADESDWVLVHDAARCLVTPAQVSALIDACRDDPVGGLLALPLPDTLKTAADGRVAATVDRGGKWLAQTPQMFRLGPLQAALAARAAQGFAGVTDEASAMEMVGQHPLLVQGSAQNFKVTYPEDFALAEAVLRSRP
ncbi:2-C-methyl-D-erythritol 4-phosphate cytidylyltransferase [Hydrogenophaga laconesensis]|uniref:2-C-methyl-D-erythritol 4-phosphate cytidylyltransferase n=1 Tax=Hydrogenophaga laconesensis TaxID=1805971 RepID=A0ABU1V4Y6_9BURK|nr:2-C-methyl-D-erythritol 4-phosphate cytidylyltransferase [Hydrogenophaga laconesensis]MDR7092523.1 2-C-methyl-D-erythritol 4-phosphate cytidylyltransferase [Hydrogenophaga laconesensis]